MQLKEENKTKLVCTKCNKEFIRSKKEYRISLRRNPNYKFVCKTCKTQETNLAKYGCRCASQSEQVKRKVKETCKKKFGYEHPAQSPEIKEKVKQHFLETLGVEAPMQSKAVQEKSRKTCKEKLGVAYPSQSRIVQEKIEQNSLQKFGTRRPSQATVVKEKAEKTCKARYGTKSFSQTDSYKDLCREAWQQKSAAEISAIVQARETTCLAEFGVKNPSQFCKIKEKKVAKRASWSDEFRRAVRSKQCKTYVYQNMHFDSSWELAVWIYAKDLGINIEREPCVLEYSVKERSFKYFPDFRFGEKLIEIKGDRFVNKSDGTWKSPVDSKYDCYYEAKRQCALANGVEIWEKEKILPILNYVKQKYGKDYLKQFKIKK